ncbi:hypothetical protein BDN72DRAFT_845046 [Pluteus cervinus]|uniref:Uncharacterized protein n=1 Tax=Pluteus cervinus TaxID=181527 RepID=A0ACD3AK11_9AGAR|nr:hypothetical protein BDN72DRAFT_845046 [Pluteus cervinus]
MSQVIKEATVNAAHPTLSSTVVLFHSLNILAFVLVLTVLITAILAKNLHRVGAWYTFLCIQLLFVITFLFYPFKSSNFSPAFVPCLLQAILVYAIPPAANWGLLALVLEVYALIQTTATGPSNQKLRFFLFGLPITIFIGEALVVLIVGLKYPSAIGMQPDALFCHLKSTKLPGIVDAVVYLIPIIVSIALFCLLGLKAYTYSRRLRVERVSVNSSFPPLSILRIVVLLLAPIFVFCCAFQQYTLLVKLSNFLPLVPILTAIAFGTQKDMISALLTWR